MKRKVPDVVLERYRLKELPENSARAVEAMLAADPELQARLDALEISDDEIHRQYRNRITLHDKPAPSPRTMLRFAVAAFVVAAASIVLILALPRTLTSPAGDVSTERAKGLVGSRPSLSIYRRTAAGSERLADCDLYVTLEPCAMCATAMSFARIRRLYFGAADPKGGAVEHGVRFFAAPTCHHRPEVYGGINESECAALLKDFFQARRSI